LKKFKYEEMTPNEFLKAVKSMPVFFVPTGLLEWHGEHLPLGLDSLKAYSLCMQTAEKLGGGIVLPPNYYGRPGFPRVNLDNNIDHFLIILLMACLLEYSYVLQWDIIVVNNNKY